MRIKKIFIQNFRNIKSLEFDVSNATVISGENELGKSNALNAIVWFFTDTIYTDNSGVGENDINSIVPKNQIKGEHTQVSIEFENGTIFTKVYKTGYDRSTGKPNKHTTEGLINSVGTKNMNEWNSKLLEVIGYTPTFTSVKELNLYIDPLYALQKLDAKQLRTLLVSFGCTATNEEMYKLGFEDLRKYESKYLGDFVNMRIDLKKQLKIINDSIDKHQILFNQYNDVEEFDDNKLTEINNKLNLLNEQKAKIKNGGNEALINKLESDLNTVLNELRNNENKLINEYNFKIKELEFNRSKYIEVENAAAKSKYKDVEYALYEKTTDREKKKSSKLIYENDLESSKTSLENTQNAAKKLLNKKKEYQAQLVAAEDRAYTGYTVCPNCGKSFVPDINDKIKFETQKKNDIAFYTEEINQFNLSIANYKKECDSIVLEAENTKLEIEKLKIEISELDSAINDIKKELDILRDSTLIDLSKLNEYDSEIDRFKGLLNNLPNIYEAPEYLEIKAKIEDVKNNNTTEYMKQLNEINNKINDIESIREDLYIERSNWRQKLDHKKNLDNAITERNNVENLIGRVNDFIHAMIKLINDKAKAKTGMDFVMLEENLGNDGVKEVCYAVVDGVPFAMINTAKKYVCGIKFIEKIKDIAVNDFNKRRNDLPILADKFEGIDHIEKIKNLTNEQLICTRVGLENKISIL